MNALRTASAHLHSIKNELLELQEASFRTANDSVPLKRDGKTFSTDLRQASEQPQSLDLYNLIVVDKNVNVVFRKFIILQELLKEKLARSSRLSVRP